MADPAAAEHPFAALVRFFIDESTIGDTLLRVAELACLAGPADMAGITMSVQNKLETGVFTHTEAPEIDQAQYSTGQGPCVDAFHTLEVYRIDSTETDTRWPDFTRDAAAHGIMSTLSLPIVARGQGLGALNLYSRSPAAFGDEDIARMTDFATHAAFVLVNVQNYWGSRQLNENLTQAISSRATIEQAVGIILASGGRSPEEAFQVLVRASQRENRKLREIASELVERAGARRTQDPGQKPVRAEEHAVASASLDQHEAD